jgi:hypothetical protein
MALAICKCKYNWPLITSCCVACGRYVASYGYKKRNMLPDPPVTMDEIADAIKFFRDGPNEVYIMAEEIAKKAINDNSDLPDPFKDISAYCSNCNSTSAHHVVSNNIVYCGICNHSWVDND